MVFNSLQFMFFLPLVVAAYYIFPDKIKHILLLLCSYYFYMCWNAVYALLMLFSTVVTYLCGLWLAFLQTEDNSEKGPGNCFLQKAVLCASLTINLAILFFFKYFDFAIDSINLLLIHIGFQLNHPSFDILLPVGISFYTFQALGYTIDIYRRDIYAERNFFRYALFVSFFPQLVAGPIERSKNLLKQLATPQKFHYDNLKEGFLLMLWGFFLKIVLADRLAVFVDTVYGPSYADYGGLIVIIATIFFAFQIYCDFGGYSIIAMGAAKMLGIQLMENFNTPYLSPNTAEFWRRWHISLSSWFRDYVYIPLGGNRKGTVRKYFNLLVTFGISGLWHGANWTFVLWGLINGIYQILGSITKPMRKKALQIFGLNPASLGHKVLCIFITFVMIDISWVFFRAQNVSAAFYMLQSMLYIRPEVLFNNSLYSFGLGKPDFTLILICLSVLFLSDILKNRGVCLSKLIMQQDAWCRALIITFSVSFILLFGIWGNAYDAASFIYFQF